MSKAITKVEGSGWASYRYDKPYSILHTLKVQRVGSYIKTSEQYNYPKQGLIPIRNEDHDCFKHCTTYHQTKHDNHDDRLTALSNFDTTHSYANILYPTSLEDVNFFAITNELCINKYNVNVNNDIISHQLGTIKYYKHMMNLVLVHDNEYTKPQFIYVENVERLLHIANTSLYTDANVCQ